MDSIVIKSQPKVSKNYKRVAKARTGGKSLTYEERVKIVSKFFNYEKLSGVVVHGDIVSPLCKWVDE